MKLGNALILVEEELRKEDFNEHINKIDFAINNIKTILKNGDKIAKHDIVKIQEYIKEVSNKITKEFYEKEKAHQNTSSVKEKYNELKEKIELYDKLLTIYISKHQDEKIETFRQTMRRFNTGKVSVKTK